MHPDCQSGCMRHLLLPIMRSSSFGKLYCSCMAFNAHADATLSCKVAHAHVAHRNLKALLVELMAIAEVSKGKTDWQLDLLPVGEDFSPD